MIPGKAIAGLGFAASVVATGVALLLGHGEASLIAGISALLLTAVLLLPGVPVAPRRLPIPTFLLLAALVAAETTAGHPVPSGLAMALACFMTSLSGAAGKAEKIAGMVLGSAYFLPAAIGPFDGVGAGQALGIGLIGVLAAIPVAMASDRVFRQRSGLPLKLDPGYESGYTVMGRDFRSFGLHTRIGLAHALPLGILMGAFQVSESINVFWIMLTVFLLLQPNRKGTFTKATDRLIGTIAAAFTVGLLGLFLSGELLTGLSFALLVVGIAKYETDYRLYTAGITCLVVALHGSADGDVLGWAALRAIDTVIGAAIAVVTVQVLFKGIEKKLLVDI